MIESLDNRTAIVHDWFLANGRDLPWRQSRNPWAILVAEVMLQQTQVSRVIEKWAEFLELFPTPQACATAPTSAIIEQWSGLGFNRRAVNLHAAATVVVDFHAGTVPTGLAELLALPGVGQYTARAVRVFAFELEDAVVDTNVARILARQVGRKLSQSEAQRAADAALPSAGQSWEWNQAMLDVGATLCVASSPKCQQGCPIQQSCAWFRSGLNEPDPALGSASVSSKQSRFAGSDRQGRGKLVEALRHRPVKSRDLAAVMGWPDDHERAKNVANQVVTDGLAVNTKNIYSLPTTNFQEESL